ncbi:MAG: methyltransferase domain-containing protein [Rhodospirillales bacterium]
MSAFASHDLGRRSAATELMDTEPVGVEEYRRCLRDLAKVNTVTLTRRPILHWLKRAMSQVRPGERVSLLDVGYGYGDVLRAVCAWSRRRGFVLDLVGLDLNPMSEPIARAATPADMTIDFRTGDVFAADPGCRFDFVIASQMTHHLSDEALVAFIQWMERTATRGWLICDLHRHAIPLHAFGLLSRLAGWHRFVRHDGPVSIARSFRRQDWQRSLAAAGQDPAAVEIRWHVPFRLSVSRIR